MVDLTVKQKTITTKMGKSGFSAIEIVISVVVLACALIPILTLVSSGKKSAAITEYHVLAQMRARRIIEVVSSYPYKNLTSLPVAETGGIKIPGEMTSTAFPENYQNKIKNYEELLFIENLETGISLATVKVNWTLATGDKRKYELCRIFTDETVGLNAQYPLRQQGGN